MINHQLLSPESIAVVGASNDVRKPGGKVLKNLADGPFLGNLFPVNPKADEVQGIRSYRSLMDLPDVDLAILAIPAEFCPETVEFLANEKSTKAFIVISAGFGEADAQGKSWEEAMVATVDSGVFTTPIPSLSDRGCDLISSSGATAVFIMEAGIPLGIRFANMYSLGNGAQIGVEEVLEYMDRDFDPSRDPKVKLLYLESLRDPQKFLRHASSLIAKGAKIAAIKAGSTQAGSRAAASHTGAMASSDITVRALFKKAGIVYCSSREELLSVASIFHYKELNGKNIAVITHAGGSAVMLADALSAGGLEVPSIEGPDAEELLTHLHPGSSVNNPIDFLATGTAEQLSVIIDYCEHRFDHIDGMIVVFGSPGLFDVEHVYHVLEEKLANCQKPIYPVLPSVINAQREIRGFLSNGHINFPDEVVLGTALPEVFKTPEPAENGFIDDEAERRTLEAIITGEAPGFLPPEIVGQILDVTGIPRVQEFCSAELQDVLNKGEEWGFPLVMKVVGPVHKTDIDGVVLNVTTGAGIEYHFNRLMQKEGVESIMIQPMIRGMELFIGVKKEAGFGHLVFCGLGGVFIEILKDVRAALAPLNQEEALNMIRNLKAYRLLQGYRNREGIDLEAFAEIIVSVSRLVQLLPQIEEMDINPLMGNKSDIRAVDVRISIEN
jgi:acetyltransferase